MLKSLGCKVNTYGWDVVRGVVRGGLGVVKHASAV